MGAEHLIQWQPSLPEHYRQMPAEEASRLIGDRRAELGGRLLILGHHYQCDQVIAHADYTGDSLRLSQLAARAADRPELEYVVFCGVHFMAETADMLTPEHVSVILPDLSAGCSMADMAHVDDAADALDDIRAALDRQGWNGRIVPITYVNSSAAVKALVGAAGGACCTSSNADRVFDWAMRGGQTPIEPGQEVKIVFLPDQHLGRNTAARFGLDVTTETCVYDPKRSARGKPLGGIDEATLLRSRVILWAGHCSVHRLFRPEHCHQIREENARLGSDEQPMRIIVHPECSKEVVDRADLVGSTDFIIRTIRSSPPGSRWAVGTEVHLVNRLAGEMARRGVRVRMLSECQCLCTTMYRIDRPHLLWVLDNLTGRCGPGPKVVNRIRVPREVREQAVSAIDRMLAMAAPAHQPGHCVCP